MSAVWTLSTGFARVERVVVSVIVAGIAATGCGHATGSSTSGGAASVPSTAAPDPAAVPAAAPVTRTLPPDAPSAPHEALTFFEGYWTVVELPPERRFRERCAWLEGGRRHMVCRSSSVNAAGQPRKGMSLFSFRAADSTYLYYGLGPGGAVEMLQGGPTASGWWFEGENLGATGRRRTRVAIERLPGGFRFVEEIAVGDGPFQKPDTIHYVALPAEP